jgi:hypothetical protein
VTVEILTEYLPSISRKCYHRWHLAWVSQLSVWKVVVHTVTTKSDDSGNCDAVYCVIMESELFAP